VSKKTWSASLPLTLTVALLLVWAANGSRSSSCATAKEEHNPLPAVLPSKRNDADSIASPCAKALAQGATCIVANKRALEIMNARQLKAVMVVQDVRTGAVVACAASQPSELDVTTPVAPLSLAKLLISASWWDNRQPDSSFDSTRGTAEAQNPAYRSRVSVHEMLVGGSDSAGRQMAVALRKSVGTKAVLKDFKRYGFAQRTDSPQDDAFWGELAPTWKTRLIPAPAYVSLTEETKDAEWAETLSIGETNIRITALHISRFLQAVGNNGVMLKPLAREEQFMPSVTKSFVSGRQLKNPIRIMQESTALRLQSAMRDTVHRGTAKSIAQVLENTGWQIGGKTGSGTALLPEGAQLDGWFAGLIFDSQGKARFTVATFVRRGGYGGENAAKISAELARYIIGEKLRQAASSGI
jgi:cell division protein FtsI/penicillin-binding protein 2